MIFIKDVANEGFFEFIEPALTGSPLIYLTVSFWVVRPLLVRMAAM